VSLSTLLLRPDAKQLVRFGSSFLILAGLVALLAWLLEWRAPLQILPGDPFMTCDAAVCFIIAGLGLFAAIEGAWRFARVLGILIVCLGALYLAANLAQITISVHSLFPALTARVIAPLPFREFHVALPTAVVFLLLGSFLIVMAQNRLSQYSLNAAALLATAVPCVGILGALFHLAGIAERRTWTGYFTSMSLATAVCACVAGTAACALFWIRTARSDRRLSSTAATLSLVGLLILFAGVNSAVLAHGRLAAQTTAQIKSLNRRIDLLQVIVESVRKAETRQRGFLLTNDERYLQSYTVGLHDIDSSFALLPADTLQTSAHLRSLIHMKLAELAATIQLHRQHQSAKALALVRSDQGLGIMDLIDVESSRLILSLKAQRRGRLNDNDASMLLVKKTVGLSSLLAAIMISLGIGVLLMEIRRRTFVESELRASSQDLQIKVDERTAEIRKYSDDLRAEAALRREASDQLRLSLQLAKVAVWTWFALEDRTVWSGAVQEVLGFTAEQMSNYKTMRELILPEDRLVTDTLIAQSVQNRQSFHAEFRIILPNGDIRWIAGHGDVVCDASGQVIRVAGFNMDISERKKVEQQLETSERHFRELAESMPQIVWTANAADEIEYRNNRWALVTGLPTGQLSAEDIQRLIHPDDIEHALQIRTAAIRASSEYEMEFRIFDVSKQEFRWQWVHAIPIRDAMGRLIRWFGTSTDIHERKIAELRLAESEQHLRARERQLEILFSNGSAGDYVWDFAKSEVTAHPAIWALFGEPNGRGSAPAEWFIARYHPDDVPEMTRQLQAALDGTHAFDVEHRTVWPDGTVRWLASRGFHVRDQDGKPTQIHGLGFDITDRKLAALQIQESERQFRELADAMPQIVWRSFASGEVDYCNARWHQYSGVSIEESKALRWEGIVHPDDLPKCIETTTQGFSRGQPFEVEFRLRRASDGEYRWHLARSVPYRDSEGSLLRWFGAATDIHELKLAKEELLRSLAEKSVLFKEMHHRVKNNLQVVSSLLRMQGDLLKDPSAAAVLKESHQRVLSMALIHEQLYSNEEVTHINFTDFTEKLVNELFHSYSADKERVTCRLDTSPVHLLINHAIPLGLILNELVTNAFKYAYPAEITGEVVISLHETAQRNVILTVSDQGVGLPENFDWSSSKSMGLPIVELLTQQLGGTLTIRSKPGAAFTVNFPLENDKVASVTAA
jgi:PAS domain S-box-containing protein